MLKNRSQKNELQYILFNMVKLCEEKIANMFYMKIIKNIKKIKKSFLYENEGGSFKCDALKFYFFLNNILNLNMCYIIKIHIYSFIGDADHSY